MFERFWSGEFSAGGGPLTQLLSQRLGALFAYCAQRISLSANTLTVLGLLLSMLASVALVSGTGWIVALWSLLLYQLSYGFDCADGQLARATGSGSDFGAWLDVNCDAAGVVSMGFALAFFFQQQMGGDLGGLLAAALVTLGRIVHLYSVPAVKGHVAAGPQLTLGRGKAIIWLLIDTPFFYLCVCVLYTHPPYMAVYLGLMGSVYGLAALNNVRRLPGAPLATGSRSSRD